MDVRKKKDFSNFEVSLPVKDLIKSERLWHVTSFTSRILDEHLASLRVHVHGSGGRKKKMMKNSEFENFTFDAGPQPLSSSLDDNARRLSRSPGPWEPFFEIFKKLRSVEVRLDESCCVTNFLKKTADLLRVRDASAISTGATR